MRFSAIRISIPTLSLRALMASLLLVCFSGCLSVRSYVDPAFHSANYQSLIHTSPPVPIALSVKFETNGQERTAAAATLQSAVTKTLEASRLFSGILFQSDAKAAKLTIVVNNVADRGNAAAKGFGTGLTMGLAGSEVVDNYVMTAEYTPAGGAPVSRTYRHALHTTIGAHSPPAGMEPMSQLAAFNQIVEDMLLNFLRDLQNAHAL